MKCTHDFCWWRHQMDTFYALLALCAGNSPVPVNSPHKGQWRGALMFSLFCVWINGWENNREACDLRRYRAHYDVIVMIIQQTCLWCGRLIVIYVCVSSSMLSRFSPTPRWNNHAYIYCWCLTPLDTFGVPFSKNRRSGTSYISSVHWQEACLGLRVGRQTAVLYVRSHFSACDVMK